MKVVSPQKMNQIEKESYQSGSSESDFMEEAGSGVALVVHEFVERYGIDRHIILLCGKGNNAGDAYVAGIHLLHLEYRVEAFQIPPLGLCSDLCQKSAERFLKEGGKIYEVGEVEEDLRLPDQGLIIDGLFGTGFKGEVREPYDSVIRMANESGLMIISVDIPSGLNGQTGLASEETINATETAYLGLPKTGFFLNQGWDKVGYLRYVDFGLPYEFIEEVEADLILLSPDVVVPFLPRIRRSRHKYEAGLVVGLAGSKGMPGAALLSSLAALRGGAGIVKLLYPKGMEAELGATPLELVKIGYGPKERQKILDLMNKASACFIGPGLSTSEETQSLLADLLPEITAPLVIDADGLNLIAELGLEIPKQAILTPHRGELARLLNRPTEPVITPEFLALCQSWVEEKEVTLVLKGAPTFILHPHQPIHVNPTGDPGMATAGVGDVLTGLIASLIAQKSAPFDAARLGVFLHGLAGEHAAQEKTSYCLIASDLLDQLPAAFAFEAS